MALPSSTLSPLLILSLLLLVTLSSLPSSSHAQIIDHVTGCPSSVGPFTYDCVAGTLVTVTCLMPDFRNWNQPGLTWWMEVDKDLHAPCTNATIVNDYQAACNLPALPANMTDKGQVHELQIVYIDNSTGGTGSSSTNVFYAKPQVVGVSSSAGGGDDGVDGAERFLGMTLTVAIVVLVLAAVLVLMVVVLVLWKGCCGQVGSTCDCMGAGMGDESGRGATSYASMT